MNDTFHVDPGMAIGDRIRIISRLGTGGACEVWRASDGDGNEVAVKIPRPGIEGAAELVRREFQALRKLSHPGVLHAVDLVETDGVPCLVTEILEGGDLVPLLGTKRAYWLRSALQVVEALEYVHESGWTHGDPKPRNVLFDGEGGAKLVDFSHATEIGRRRPGEGTPGYRRPGRTLVAVVADDVYAFAVTLYELTAGRLPFGEDDSDAYRELKPELAAAPEAGATVAALDDLIIDTLTGQKNASPGSVRPFTDVLKSAVSELE